jgi:hypothetical protein
MPMADLQASNELPIGFQKKIDTETATVIYLNLPIRPFWNNKNNYEIFFLCFSAVPEINPIYDISICNCAHIVFYYTFLFIVHLQFLQCCILKGKITKKRKNKGKKKKKKNKKQKQKTKKMFLVCFMMKLN